MTSDFLNVISIRFVVPCYLRTSVGNTELPLIQID